MCLGDTSRRANGEIQEVLQDFEHKQANKCEKDLVFMCLEKCVED